MYVLTMEQGRGSQAEHIGLAELKRQLLCRSGEAEASGSSGVESWKGGSHTGKKKIALGISSKSPWVFADLSHVWDQTPGDWERGPGIYELTGSQSRDDMLFSSCHPEWRAHVAHWECPVELVKEPHLCTEVKIVVKTTNNQSVETFRNDRWWN